MRRFFGLAGATALFLSLLPVGGIAAGAAPDSDAIPGSYIVVMGSGDPGAVAAEHSRAHNARVGHVYRHALRGYTARMSARAAERIARDPRVASVEQDRVVTVAHHQCGHRNRWGDGACPTTGTVAGTVTAQVGGAIGGATVTVDGKTATTDSTGSYSIADVAAGSNTVTASAAGYVTASTTVTVSGGETSTADLALAAETTVPPPEPEPELDYLIPTGLARSFWNPTAVGRAYPGVAILDTGIATHPDLTIAAGYNCTGRSANDYRDGNGHGTHVAGTVAAGGGVVGMAPGAPLYAVKVLSNNGSGSWSTVICGIDYVTARADTIKVANLSLSGSGSAGSTCASSALRQAICNSVNAGVTYVAAAGNEGADAGGSLPAALPEVITVAALADFDGAPGGRGTPTCRSDSDDTVANFSNYGSAVDIIAPGVCITSTWHTGGTHTISGTSMAAPHVAGAAALWLSGTPDGGTPAQVRDALLGAGNFDYSFTWNGFSLVPGTKWPLLDVRSF